MGNCRGEDGLQTGGSIDGPTVGLSYIEKEGSRVMPYHRMVVLLLALFALTLGSAAPVAAKPKKPAQMKLLQRLDYQNRALQQVENTQRWFAKRHVRLTQSRRPPQGAAAYKLWWNIQKSRWLRKERNETVKLIRLRLMGDIGAWTCIHGGEASWNYDKDVPGHNGTYDGGLQMDLDFQRTYGPVALGFASWEQLLAKKGTADKWTPREQIIVAEYARRSGRVYYPWPNTAHYCGLI